MTITISPSQLPTALLGEMELMPKLMPIAVRRACNRLKAYLVNQSDALGITDRGIYKRSFVVSANSVTNVAPHGPIVEEGARPHKLSPEALENLAGWVRRKLRKTTYSLKQKRNDSTGRFETGDELVTKQRRYRRGKMVYTKVEVKDSRGRFTGDQDVVGKKVGDEAMKIAWAIAKTIEKYGQKGRYVMRDALPMAKQFFHEELTRLIARERTGIKKL